MPTELQVKQELRPETPNAMQLLQSAVSQGASIDTIERLAKLQREIVEFEAKVAFDEAMQRAQEGMKPIGADMFNPQTKSRYSSYAKLDRAMRPIYSREGFSVSFDTGEPLAPDMIRVLAYVSHRRGHTRTYKLDMPADGKGAKGGDVMTKTHATGAATSYGMRNLLKMIWNIAIGEEDDDGNLGGNLDEADFIAMRDSIENASTLDELQKVYKAAYKAAVEAKDKQAMTSFIERKDRRKEELR